MKNNLVKQRPTLEWENKYPDLIVAGVDEVGRGPWAGPVVTSAVILDPLNIPEGINDSKKLSLSKREEIYNKLIEVAEISVGLAEVEEIDNLNILAATKLAMQRAVDKLKNKPQVILVDGNQSFNYLAKVVPIIKGDAISLSIAAASIVAKVTRDRIMQEIAKEFPYYGFEKNVGYGTKSHQDGINKYGVTKYHRKSFKPIAKIINK